MQYNLALYHTVNIFHILYINQYISYILNKTKFTTNLQTEFTQTAQSLFCLVKYTNICYAACFG